MGNRRCIRRSSRDVSGLLSSCPPRISFISVRPRLEFVTIIFHVFTQPRVKFGAKPIVSLDDFSELLVRGWLVGCTPFLHAFYQFLMTIEEFQYLMSKNPRLAIEQWCLRGMP